MPWVYEDAGSNPALTTHLLTYLGLYCCGQIVNRSLADDTYTTYTKYTFKTPQIRQCGNCKFNWYPIIRIKTDSSIFWRSGVGLYACISSLAIAWLMSSFVRCSLIKKRNKNERKRKRKNISCCELWPTYCSSKHLQNPYLMDPQLCLDNIKIHAIQSWKDPAQSFSLK